MKTPYWVNKRFVKRFLACSLAFACATTTLPTGSLSIKVKAADVYVSEPEIVTKDKNNNNLWVNGSAYEESNSLDAIKWYYKSSSSQYYLYLPSSVDLNNLVIWHTFSNGLYCNGNKIESGKATNIFSNGGSYKLTSNGTTYNLKVYQSQKINSMFITTKSGSLSNVNKSKSNTDSGSVVYVDNKGKAAKVGLETIKGRGNSSWDSAQQIFKKYPYSLKFDEKVKVFGMGKSKKWALLANNFDQALIRDKFIYDLASDAGMEYSPESELVDVYENGRYIGNYTISSKIEVASKRVNIRDLEEETEVVNGLTEGESLSKYGRGGNTTSVSAGAYKYYNIPNNPEDITGGYLCEFELDERFNSTKSGFVSSRRQQVNVSSPEYASKEQVKYIKNYFQEMEDAVYSSNGKNSLGKHFTEYMDITSAAQMYIIEELTMDIDAVATSFFMYKDTNGKIKFGPAWDYDWSMGNYANRGLLDVNYMYVQKKHIYKNKDVMSSETEVNFLGRLMKHEEFKKEVARVWTLDFYPLLKVATGSTSSTTAVNKLMSISKYGSLCEASANMNFSRNEGTLGSAYWGSYCQGKTYADNISALNTFVKNRTNVMNNLFKSYGYTFSTATPAPTATPTAVPTQTPVTAANVASFDYSNANKTAGADLDEYATEDTYTYNATSGNGTMTATITGDAKKHISWSSDSYTTEDGTVVGIVPAIGASKSNNWTENASVTVNTSTKHVEKMKLSLQIGATKKGPANYKFTITDGTNSVELGTCSLTKNKTLKNVSFDIPSAFNDKDNVQIIVSLANTTTVGGTDLSEAPTGGEFVINGLQVKGTYMNGYYPTQAPQTQSPVPTATVAPTATATVAPTATATVAPTQNPVGNKAIVYYKRSASTSWTTAYAHYKVNGVWTVSPGVEMVKESAGYWKITLDLGDTTEATMCFNNGSGSWDSNSSKNYTVYAGTYLVNQTTKTVTLLATQAPSKTEAPTVAPTQVPTQVPTVAPTQVPTAVPTVAPTQAPTAIPTAVPTAVPTQAPTAVPTAVPTQAPTAVPTEAPTAVPTQAPTAVPTAVPTQAPTVAPTATATVVPTQTPVTNMVTVYYKRSASTSWKNAYVHYKVNGTWTVSPGVAMEKVSAGYWKLTINLGTATEATMCFNNGSGSWDSNSSKNYTVYVGSYLVDQTKKTVTKMDVEETQTPATQTPATQTPTAVPTKVPTQAPTTAPATQAPTVTPTQNPVGNKVTVYYKRSTSTSWKNAYMHYKVNGVWTISPGVAMEKVSAGYWKLTVDLGDATEAIVDFNTGDGTWDNNSKKHYTVYAGTYLVDQTKKTVTSMK